MLSLGIAILAAVVAFVVGKIEFGIGSGILLAVVAGPGLAILLVRKPRKAIQAAQVEIEKDLGAHRFERAIERLDGMRPYARWQPLLASQIDEQIGTIRYAALDDPAGARPYLERARNKGAQSWTMLAASVYRRSQREEWVMVFERATRRRSKDPLLWATYAWCKLTRGSRTEALDVLTRARKRLPSDDRLRRLQIAAQSGKPMRMRAFGPDWFALRLERMPQGAGQNAPSPSHPAFRRRGGRQR